VLVKELQGLSLKVDLLAENQEIDAEKILAENIKDEASHAPTLTSAPADDSTAATVTADDLSEEDLASMTEEESPPTAEEVALEDEAVNINQDQEEEA
jgi:hypothetical protein